MTPPALLAATAPTAQHVRSAISNLTIHTPRIDYLTIVPVLVLLGGAVLLLAVSSLVHRPLRLVVATAGTVVVALAALGVSLWQWFDVRSHGPTTSISHAVVMDGFSALIAITVCCAMVLSALVADGYLRREGTQGAELHVLALVSAAGAVVMAEANDLVLIFLGLEILSIALYVLAAMNHRRAASGEGALKYFVLGGFSSAIFVYGIALTYGATGSTNLTQIADFLSKNVVLTDGLLVAGLALLLVGFAFKIGAVPFHMWTPDVYQGSPTPVTGFMAAVAKAGAFAALLRVFVSTFGVLRVDWQPIIYVLAVASLVVGAALALTQTDVKRMMAYSSINHAGFILLGVQAATVAGVSAALYYVFTYTFMVIGTFAVFSVLARTGDRGHQLAGYRGLARRQPLLALSLAVLLLAQAGAPFTTGFLAKFQVVDAAVEAHSVPLAVIAMVTAAVAAFFYLRLAVIMYSPVRGDGSALDGSASDGSASAADGSSSDGSASAADGSSGGAASVAPGPVAAGAPLMAGTTAHPLWAGSERAVATATRINSELILDADTPAEDGDGRVGQPVANLAPDESEIPATVVESSAVPLAGGRVPVLSALAIGLCVGVTVVFGIIPAPLVDFAKDATLLFFPH